MAKPVTLRPRRANEINVFMTNVDGTDESIMVFGTLTAEVVAAGYRKLGVTFDECYEVPGRDLSYYLYDPVFLTPRTSKRLLEACKS